MPDDNSLPYQRDHQSSRDGADAALPNAMRDRQLVYDCLLRNPGLTDDGIWRHIRSAYGDELPNLKEGTIRRARDELSKRNVVETLPDKVLNPSGVMSNAYRVIGPMPNPWTSARREARPQVSQPILDALAYLESVTEADADAHPEAGTLLTWIRGQFDRGRFPAPTNVTPAQNIAEDNFVDDFLGSFTP